MTQRLILASNNAGKLKEFNELLSTVGYDVHAQGEYQVPEGLLAAVTPPPLFSSDSDRVAHARAHTWGGRHECQRGR